MRRGWFALDGAEPCMIAILPLLGEFLALLAEPFAALLNVIVQHLAGGAFVFYGENPMEMLIFQPLQHTRIVAYPGSPRNIILIRVQILKVKADDMAFQLLQAI